MAHNQCSWAKILNLVMESATEREIDELLDDATLNVS